MSGVGFDTKKAVLDHRRAVVPTYRDIRDRPTWELLDVLILENDPATNYGGGVETALINFNDSGIMGSYVRRISRKDFNGNLVFDGTRQMSQLAMPFGSNTNNELTLLEDFYLIGPNNSQNLHANGQDSFAESEIEAGVRVRIPFLSYLFPDIPPPEALRSLPVYNLSVTFGSGSWTNATNVIINPRNFDPITNEQPVEIYRALN
jgi:hypothetical protein